MMSRQYAANRRVKGEDPSSGQACAIGTGTGPAEAQLDRRYAAFASLGGTTGGKALIALIVATMPDVSSAQ